MRSPRLAGLDRAQRGHRIMAIMRPCQGRDGGSTPPDRNVGRHAQ